MAALTITGVCKNFGDTPVLRGIDLAIEQGEFIVFVGPSGCGKSTLLRLIAGLDTPDSGSIAIAGVVVDDLPPAERGIAMVFQSYALYPHMTVAQNMAFGMKMARADAATIARRVAAAAELLQIVPLLDRLPRQLSGGQRQRVAIGRAITRDPAVFLFDEPLSNLDAALRVATRIEIARLKDGLPDTTMIYVTHDQVEAMTLADRIVVLNAGRIEQVGTPIALYERPANRFVAQFIGTPAMNILPAVGGPAGAVSMGIRPEHLTVADGDAAELVGRVTLVERLGDVTLVHVTLADGTALVAKLPPNIVVARDTPIGLDAIPAQRRWFDAAGMAIA
jgi:ABC-type sugar transport system ATPase subunit